MGEYRRVGGLDMWFDEAGSGSPLILLHGGMCTNETWAAQIPAFSERFRVIAPERRAHGHTADVPGPLTYAAMAQDTIGFLEAVVERPSHLVGWSDGGIVVLLVAIERPELVDKLVVIGTNFDVAGVVPEAAAMLSSMDPDGEDMAMFRELYSAHSPDGPEHWPVFFGKFVEMIEREPTIPVDDLSRIASPTLILVGDDDMVTLEHTNELYRAIPNAELAVVPGIPPGRDGEARAPQPRRARLPGTRAGTDDDAVPAVRPGRALNRKREGAPPAIPEEWPRALTSNEIRRRPTLPGGLPPSTIGAGSLNFRVRDGNGCDPAAMATEICCQGGSRQISGAFRALQSKHEHCVNPSPRPISTGRLNTLPCVHLRPINVMVSSRALLR